MRLAVVSGLRLALAAVANAAVREEPLPAEPLSDDGSARTTLLRGEDIVDLVNEAALARAPTSSAAPSTCASGFRDLAALATVGNVTLSPVVEAVVERAMRDLQTVPGAPLPHVLNFVLFQTPPNETETETETNPERDRDEDGQP